MGTTMETEVSRAEVPSVPSALVAPPPRKVQITGSGIALASLTIVVIAAAVIYACFVATEAARQFQIRAALRGHGNETAAQIDQLRNPYHAVKEYVDYRFLADGKTYAGEAIVPLEDWHIIKSTGVIPIRYLPENPAMNHPVGWEWSAFSEWDGYGVVIFIAGFLFALFIPGRMRFERRLAAEGIATTGVVTKCSVSGRSGNFITLTYEFHTKDGVSMRGRGSFQTRQEVGAHILILYFSQKPKKNVPYPLSAWRIATL